MVLLLTGLTCACGGASTEGPASADDVDESGDSESFEAGEGPASAGPSGPDCSGGTCFSCGESMCLPGYYCDHDVAGGPACSWLPECVESASCDCVKKVLGKSCDCEERNGGTYVSCK
jgi:hypothetical protein